MSDIQDPGEATRMLYSQGQQVLFWLRDQRPEEAIKLLKEGADVDFYETGCSAIHIAAQEGYNDVIEVLLEKGAKVHAWDKEGQTALHKAAIRGHSNTIITLVGLGARVSTLDKQGRLPLEHAMTNKHVGAVQLLCLFGTEPTILYWTWLNDPNLKKTKAECEIAKLLNHQRTLASGYKHSAIIFDVKYIPAGSDPVHLTNTNVHVSGTDRKDAYYLYLCRMEAEFGSPDLAEDEQTFGRVLECQTWGTHVPSLTLTVIEDRALNVSDQIVIRTNRKGGSIDKVEQLDVANKAVTKVTLTVPLAPKDATLFAMATKETKEKFKISMEAVTLKPKMEPDAEIDIPSGAFHSGELSIKFVDTKEVNEEVEESAEAGDKGGTPLLMTNVIDLSTTDGQQPSKDIQLKLPVTTKEKTDDFIVLSTSNPDPNLLEWIWDQIPAEIDSFGKAVFSIKHFTIYAGASKARVEEDAQAVESAIRQSVLKNRKIHFLVIVNTPQPNELKTDVIILCGTPRTTMLRKKKLKQTYECFEHSKSTFLVPEGQSFQIRIHGNVRESSNDENLKIIFKGSGSDNSRALEIVSKDNTSEELSGEVEILTETKFYPETKKVDVCCLFNKSKEVTKMTSDVFENAHVPLVRIPFNRAITRIAISGDEEDEDDANDIVEERKDKCIIPALMWKNLRTIMKGLSPEDARHLGPQLGLKTDVMEQVEKDTQDDANLALNVIRKWRLKLPGSSQVDQLKKALDCIGRPDVVESLDSVGTEEQHDSTANMELDGL